ncbi:hypothetical protein EYF80_055205 [Liparis tanakae]|uniref:Uncharacterized protein n=1 Tax=Liparis tanakae TaxID=230148 RepID=A0A4Z2F0G9_9TELE|nr:hypothetical protein EYF80_055205 [Liparis tanakae]
MQSRSSSSLRQLHVLCMRLIEASKNAPLTAAGAPPQAGEATAGGAAATSAAVHWTYDEAQSGKKK